MLNRGIQLRLFTSGVNQDLEQTHIETLPIDNSVGRLVGRLLVHVSSDTGVFNL